LRTVIQACGRVVRAPDDYGATYLADDSVLDLFERARTDTPSWFRDQVDAMTAPSLPPFDPAAALASIDADPAGTVGTGASGSTDATTARPDAESRPRSGSRTRSEADADRRENHPLSDVWGDG
jgi:hypothetical protein